MPSKKKKQIELTPIDKKILNAMFDLKDTNLNLISKKVGLSKSTVHNRIKRLKMSNFFTGIMPLINQEFIQKQITAISLIKAKYGPEYAEEVGKRIANIRGIWAVYFVLGSNDFVALIRAKNKDELEYVLNELTKTEGVERSDTIMVIKILKEDLPDSLRLTFSEFQ
ncbi:MAG: Lrp/AsnC family transcriptional regulator [Thermoplasmata archaeon]